MFLTPSSKKNPFPGNYISTTFLGIPFLPMELEQANSILKQRILNTEDQMDYAACPQYIFINNLFTTNQPVT